MSSEHDNDDVERTPIGIVFGKYLDRRGLRWTPQRRRILEIVNGLPVRFDARDAIECANTGRATVYRTLWELSKAGLLEQSGDQFMKRGLG